MADELGFGREPEKGLDHGQRDQFCGGEFGGDPNGGSFGSPFGVFDQRVVDGHLQSCREGVQLRVHPTVLKDQGLLGPLILDTLALYVVDDRAHRAHPLELIT